MAVRAYRESDVASMIAIWNEVVEEGVAFPQEEYLTPESGSAFFKEQTHCGVYETEEGEVVGMYVLHPNNVGRCGHICNASYAVLSSCRGQKIGEALVKDCLVQGKRYGFSILQFNAVVAANMRARKLYKKLGFVPLGVIPKGFRMKDGHYEDICPYYYVL